MPVMFPDLSQPPDELAHDANDNALRAQDARSSREALEKEAREESRDSIQPSRGRIILFAILAFAFPALQVWEWMISREIYQVLSPGVPWAPFVFCSAIAIYVSACLSDGSSRFLLTGDKRVARANDGRDINRYIDEMYGRRKKTNWFLNPLVGAVFGILLLAGVYLGSLTRVKLMEAAGEMTDVAGFQVYLPVMLHGAEIIFGIPAFLFSLWTSNLIHIKRVRTNLAQARDREITFSQSAVRGYEEYVAQLAEYNSIRERDGKPPRALIPPNQALRRLLADAGHRDMGEKDYGHHQNDQVPFHHPDTTEAAMYPGDATSGMNRGDMSDEDQEDDRIDDLTSLLDEQISSQNRGL